MSDVLDKIIAGKFYKINAGFFLLFFILFFGILNGKETIDLHHAFMSAISSSFHYTIIAMVIWALYNFKCISFTIKEINKEENSFLFNLQALGNWGQYYLLLKCQAALFAPLLLYAFITVVVGLREHHYLLPVIFMIYQALMCGIAAIIYFNQLNSTWKKPAVHIPSFELFHKKSFSFYLLHYSLYSRKGTFAGIKFFSLLLLQIMVLANREKVSKEAVCVLITFLISAHSLLPLYYVQFMEQGLTFSRNLPIPVMKRFAVYVLTYAVIFLPELLFLFFNERDIMPVQLILSLYAVAISQMALYTSFQYIKGMNTERYTTFVFVIFFATLLLLASSSPWFVFVAEGVVAVGVFRLRYWRYAVEKE